MYNVMSVWVVICNNIKRVSDPVRKSKCPARRVAFRLTGSTCYAQDNNFDRNDRRLRYASFL